MDIAARLEVVEQENERLRDRVAQLEGILFEPDVRMPMEMKLTPREERLVAFLLKRVEGTKEQMLIAIYGVLPEADEPEIKIIDVFICKARRKLAPFKIKIETLWGRGYFMPPESKTTLRAMLPYTDVRAA